MAQNLERWLFVCSGNICRSPFAEAAARALSTEAGFEFASAGTIALAGNPASAGGVAAAWRLDIDLTEHRATHLTTDVVAGADLVLCMEEEHLAAVLALDPRARAELLSPDGLPIPDPYGGDRAEYDFSYRLIVEALVARLTQRPGHDAGKSLS